MNITENSKYFKIFQNISKYFKIFKKIKYLKKIKYFKINIKILHVRR